MLFNANEDGRANLNLRIYDLETLLLKIQILLY